ncbi:sensor histidine kinase [Mucilaginibacter flavus]|uniref:sensor histidine kinase n=1 Tax=Mucilaginibacter flavus TaxID=931504 RepID=UPI0025B4685C|nr:histidine kinase [Mucilaginibacter flavus]MDN3583969.1 histidine kinase [Mucilaginibacter flavus]
MAFAQSKQNWFIRYKLYHIPFWIVYDYLLWALKVDSATEAAKHMFLSVYFFKSFFYVIFPTFAVYLNLYFLVPKYLAAGRYAIYLTYLLLSIIVASVLIVPGYYISAWLAGSTVEKSFGFTTNFKNLYELIKEEPFRYTLAITTLAMSIKLAKNWIETQRKQRLLEKEKLETELKFLKYQFNPHFLFNSINSIFFLIHKNPDMASASLAKFSELLRHQLYESNDSVIPLNKEMAYLENFIGLEKLRQSPNLVTTFNIDEGCSSSLGVAPFILMTFVENAFKHVSKHKDGPNWIKMDILVDSMTLKMDIANSRADNDSRQAIHYGGIGLKNVQRRLDLLYPGQHQLSIHQTTEEFKVKLELQLAEVNLSPAHEFINL